MKNSHKQQKLLLFKTLFRGDEAKLGVNMHTGPGNHEHADKRRVRVAKEGTLVPPELASFIHKHTTRAGLTLNTNLFGPADAV